MPSSLPSSNKASIKAAKRATKIAKFTSGFAWLFGFLTILLIILLNTAGTSIQNNGSISSNIVTGSIFPIFSLTAPYNELDPSGNLSFTYSLYLNGACMQPTDFIADTIGPYCFYSHPGWTFDLSAILHQADSSVSIANDASFHLHNTTAFPTETAQDVHMTPVQTYIPFIFYMISIALILVSLVTLPRGFCGIKWGFGRKFLNLIIVLCASTFTTAAAGLLTYFAFRSQRELQNNDYNSKHVTNPTLSNSFLALIWAIAGLMIAANILLFVEWGMEKRDIINEKTGKVWKATGSGRLGGLRRHKTSKHKTWGLVPDEYVKLPNRSRSPSPMPSPRASEDIRSSGTITPSVTFTQPSPVDRDVEAEAANNSVRRDFAYSPYRPPAH